MKVTIWDLDYYHSKVKRNCYNVDVMKISSYHKQLGDQINFVTRDIDINRPYDIYYIIKENKKTPNPPLQFFANRKVRWYGKAFEMRQNFKLTDAILACRPDYLLYPERETRQERAEQIRLLGNNRTLLPITQDWTNSFKDKDIIVTDPELWFAEPDVIIAALDKISHCVGVSFQEPIWWPKIINNPSIWEKLMQLKWTKMSKLTWNPIAADLAAEVINHIVQFRQKFPTIVLSPINIKYSRTNWKTKQEAFKGFELLKEIIISAKENEIPIKIIAPKTRYDTPFFFLPELCEEWTNTNFKISWLEFISKKYYIDGNIVSGSTEWNKPKLWNPLFRDALRQTWFDKKFLLLQWGPMKISENEIPWKIWEDEFKYEI